MFIDTRRLDEGALIEAEVCIIGGGIAGITLALEFEKQGVKTCLIESGGFSSDRATRDLYRGESVGLPYSFADGTRCRFLGGSSNCWGGWCRPLDEHDFVRREWVPNSGWPISKLDLQPYYDKSRHTLKLGPNRFDTEFWVDAIGNKEVYRLPIIGDWIADGIAQFSPPVRFGTDYREELAGSKLIAVYLYANVVNIETDGVETVRRLTVKTLTGRTASASARVFILATGGIENARLLLASNKERADGLGNHNGLVGRFYMDHPRMYSGKIHFRDAWKNNLLFDQRYHIQNKAVAAHGTCVSGQLGLTPELQAKERLLNARVCFTSVFPGKDSDVGQALDRIKQKFMRNEQFNQNLVDGLLTLGAHPIRAAEYVASTLLWDRSSAKYARFQIIIEQAPDPDSRIILSQQCDRLGENRVKIDWRINAMGERTVDRTLAIIAEDLTKAGVADIILDTPVEGGNWPDSFEEEGTWHHMGSTRMHESPKLGVVDRDCRVYGTNNLYVAGSSVFPTGGANVPTMTIVALALRLSDHIVKVMQPPGALTAQ
jgi:choline dehydrogenase-like flavoprotein